MVKVGLWGIRVFCAAAAALNVAMFIWSGRHWWSLASAAVVSASGLSYLWMPRLFNWRKSCSTNPSPTSGTSQSPDPSSSLDLSSLSTSELWRRANPATTYLSANPSPPEAQAPAIPTSRREMPVIGFRAWNVAQNFKLGVGSVPTLGAIGSHGQWQPGSNSAVCNAYGTGVLYHPPKVLRGAYASYAAYQDYPDRPIHEAPGLTCQCGFWVLSDLDRVPFLAPDSTGAVQAHRVVGAVMGWGRVVQHGAVGWRAQKARVVALLDCKWSDEHLALTHQVAEAYGVPVLQRDALELYVKEFGERFPALTELPR